jgi:hypothetical protein
VEAVHILVRRNAFEAKLAIQPVWQGKLQQDAVYIGPRVQGIDAREQIILSRVGGQALHFGVHTDFQAGPLLVAHIGV